MKIIKKNEINVLIPEEKHSLKQLNDFENPPYYTKEVFLAKSIDTLEKAQKIWEEIQDSIIEEIEKN